MHIETRVKILSQLCDDLSVLLNKEINRAVVYSRELDFYTVLQKERNMGYNLKTLKALKATANAAALEGVDRLNAVPLHKLQSIANGIGPEAFPEWLRSTIDALHPSLKPVALIHDLDWHENDGKDSTFKASNERFKTNGYKMAAYRYGWYDPRRYIVRRQTRRFYRMLSLFGGAAFKAAKKGKSKK